MSIDVALFDLGGVLVDLGGGTELASVTGLDVPEFWRRWIECPWVRDFERGRIAEEAFAEGLVREWSLTLAPREFLEVFARWPRGLFAGAEELLVSLRRRVRVACLSNTNVVHWRRQGHEWGLERLLDARFLSFEMGLVKPDRESFERALEHMGVGAEAVLFLDDHDANVTAARRLGIRAERVLGLEGARRALAAHGLA